MDATELAGLLAGGPLLADGGMGTSLIARGAPVGACLEALNVDDPADVDARASRVRGRRRPPVLTNTFGANRFRLGRHGLADRVGAINRAGVSIARAGAGARFVGGSMGPLGVRLAPYGRVGLEDALAAYARAGGGARRGRRDLLVDRDAERPARDRAGARGRTRGRRRARRSWRSATFTRDDRTLLGETPAQVAARLAEPRRGRDRRRTAERVRRRCCGSCARCAPRAGGRPLVARPNAGGPHGGRRAVRLSGDAGATSRSTRWRSSTRARPSSGAAAAPAPTHTAAIAAALASEAAGRAAITPRIERRRRTPALPRPPAPEPTALEARLLARATS